MAITLFTTETEALEWARQMAGWDTDVVEYTTLEGQEGWVIQAQTAGSTGQPTYLHDDGLVR